MATDDGFRPPDEEVRWMARQTRNTCTPDVALEAMEIWHETDIRNVLPSVQVPTLLLADEGGRALEVAEYVGSLMPNATLQSIPHKEWPSGRAIEPFVLPYRDAMRRFLGLEPERPSIDTVLVTVLSTDIVGSTERQAAIGDRAWKDLVQEHHAIVRSALERWRGVENDTAGDGFFATFDGPARAIHCALEVTEWVRPLDIEIRAGVHTGECEVIDGKAGGIAASTGARISALAGASEVLVSQTVKDLVAGSGLSFEDTGERELKGIPDRWRLYRVTSGQR
jgi:class 3 adenylate cyclase